MQQFLLLTPVPFVSFAHQGGDGEREDRLE